MLRFIGKSLEKELSRIFLNDAQNLFNARIFLENIFLGFFFLGVAQTFFICFITIDSFLIDEGEVVFFVCLSIST